MNAMTRKLGTTGAPIDVSSRWDELRRTLEDVDGLAAVYLYGSYGTPYQTPLSDVDLALIFRRPSERSWRQKARLTGEIMAALDEEDVSVSFLDEAPVAFQHKVIAEGRLLYLFDEEVHADFLARTFSRYSDFAVAEARFLREYDACLVEEYLRGPR